MAVNGKAVDEKIIDKILKLHALTSSPNENEAEVALAKMQEYLIRYNLTMSEVHRKTETKSSYIREIRALDKNEEWRRVLIARIADHAFCKAYFYRLRHRNEIVLIGEKENVEVVWEMFAFVVPQLEKQCEREFKRYKQQGGMLHGKAWKFNFYDGANTAIKNRLEREKRELEASINDCRALIVLKDKELTEAVKTFYNKIYNFKHHHTFRGNDGYSEGKVAGRAVRLRKEVKEAE